jgi:histidinol dehydrogenase
MTALRILLSTDPDFAPQVEALRQLLCRGELQSAGSATGRGVAEIVRDIIAQVASGGDHAAARLASELDRAALRADGLHVPTAQIEQAWSAADPEFLTLVRAAAANIRAYQTQILQQAPAPLVRGGRSLGVRYRPLRRVAVYVPGGRALYPSTVLMTVVPALVAGVREIVMVTPPTGGQVHPLALALARELGVTEVVSLGGAVGIAAVALGTESIAAVDKVVGPGNAFVAEAKRQLFGRVGIDSIAGPSEVFIVADASVSPTWVAADLIAQAEHDPGSAILATPDRHFAEAVASAVEAQLVHTDREAAARASLERYGAILVTPTLQIACELANRFAAEHLQIMTRDDDACLGWVDNAGAIFVGAHTPVPLGDYFAGPSHVLPTGGTARFAGPLSCNDFLKASSVLRYDSGALADDAARVAQFAEFEGLSAHAAAVRVRKP